DSANVLWRQVVGIATPSELRAWWAGVPPEAKGTWLESFWARRNPNLFASTNHRIVEHFSRLRYARKHYPLLHPLVSYHRSSVARTLNLEPAQGEREFHLRCEVFKALPPYYSGGRVPLPGVSSVRDRARDAGDGPPPGQPGPVGVHAARAGARRLFRNRRARVRPLDGAVQEPAGGGGDGSHNRLDEWGPRGGASR